MLEPQALPYRAAVPKTSEGAGPQWARALAVFAVALSGNLSAADRNRVRATAWPILRTALTQLVRQHAARLGPVPVDALEDLAAEKSLELMLKCEAGAWVPDGWSAQRLSWFLSRVARNSVIDHLRSFGPRRITPSWEDLGIAARIGVSSESPATGVEASEYATHLLAGLQKLSPRARIVWYMRVCLEWPSRRIATHPRVQMPPSHVDVELQRTRARLRSWMESCGFDIREIPPGTSAALWNACLREGSIPTSADPQEEEA